MWEKLLSLLNVIICSANKRLRVSPGQAAPALPSANQQLLPERGQELGGDAHHTESSLIAAQGRAAALPGHPKVPSPCPEPRRAPRHPEDEGGAAFPRKKASPPCPCGGFPEPQRLPGLLPAGPGTLPVPERAADLKGMRTKAGLRREEAPSQMRCFAPL